MINFKHKKYYRPSKEEEQFEKTYTYIDESCQFCERYGLWFDERIGVAHCKHCGEKQGGDL